MGDLISTSGFPALLDSLRNTPHPIVTVGDTTTLNFVSGNVVPDLSIIDLGTRRGSLTEEDNDLIGAFMDNAEVVRLENPQEWITLGLWDAVRDFFSWFRTDVKREGYTGQTGSGEERTGEKEKGINVWDRKTGVGPARTDAGRPSGNRAHKKFKIGRPDRMGTTPKIIWIEGEEDLASLPCIHFSNRGGHVFYGLPDKGLIHIQVHQVHRTIVRDALRKMEAYDEPLNNQSDRQSTA